MLKSPPQKKKDFIPNWDEFLEDRKKNLVSYAEGARYYSMNYYAFVALARKANANVRIKNRTVVNLDILDAYLEEFCKGEPDDVSEKTT